MLNKHETAVPRRALRIWSARIGLTLLGLLGLALLAGWLFLRASLPRLDGSVAAAGLAAPVSVARDAGGVPVISGSNRLDVAYASGYVHAQDRFFQMDLLRRVAAGELAELFGTRALDADRTHRLHRFRARAGQAVQLLPADQRQLLDRYVAGVNDGLAALAARPFEYALLGVKPRAWSAADSLLVVWAMYFDLQGSQAARKLARGWLDQHSTSAQRAFLLPEASQWDAPLDAPAVAADGAAPPAAAPAWWGRPHAPGSPALAHAEQLYGVGSNNWALAGARSAHGAAIVSDDMHLGIALPNTWYRAVLRFPDGAGRMRRIVGVTLPGAPPVVVVGSNGHVAWGFTNSYGDFLDLIPLQPGGPERPGQWRTPAGWESALSHEETILVKGAAPHTLLVRETSLGPLREVAGRTYAVHWVAHAAGAINLNLGKMEAADSVEQALAIAPGMGMPAQNLVAGDAAGNIGWTIAGQLPARAGPAAPWQGWLAPRDYPQLRNPAGGQLYTANSRQLMGPGAALLGDGGFDLGARTRQVRDGLRALGPKTDVHGAWSVMFDDRALFLAPWRARALAALDGAALAGQPQRARFRHLLESGWSGHASVDSVGYRLARSFMYALYDLAFAGADAELARLDAKASVAVATRRWPAVLARLLDAQPAGWLPPGYASWQALQLAAIDRVIAELDHDGLPLEAATWGARNTAAIAHPLAAALPWLRRWLAAPSDMLPGDSHMPRVTAPNSGQSERLTVAPGREEEGLFNMPGGQSGHPLSPFFLAGHDDWVRGRPQPLLPGPAQHTLRFLPARQ